MKRFQTMADELRAVCEQNILPFWINQMADEERGGFYGRMDGHDLLHPDAERGAVLNARLLWSFSAAYRVLHNDAYLQAALRAKHYIEQHFLDKEEGGVYWSVDCGGHPLDMKKQTYAIGFMIYGFSEFHRATGDEDALSTAIGLFHDIERHAFDAEHNGYVEAFTRDWQPIADMRLSDKDENGALTMNTHLHVIEPYTNLYRCVRGTDFGEQVVKKRIVNLLHIFTTRLLNPTTFHLDLFFDNQWQGLRNIQSFGHDIEAVWLLHEAALELAEPELLEKTERLIPKIATAADEGLQEDGSMVYERWTDTGRTDMQRQWWVMCECIIGHADLWQYLHDTHALDIALRCWDYTKRHLIDWNRGEWHWSILPDGQINLDDDKAGFWKCPYHNTRLCLEIIERNETITNSEQS